MTHPAARGERFLAVAGDFLSMRDIAKILKRRLGAAARRVPTWQLPNFLVRLAALREPSVRQILPELGKLKNASGEKARRMSAGFRAPTRRRSWPLPRAWCGWGFSEKRVSGRCRCCATDRGTAIQSDPRHFIELFHENNAKSRSRRELVR